MRTASLFVAWTALIATSSGLVLAQQASYGSDLRNRPIYRLASSQDKAVVLFFVATDCPISNRYAPEVQRLKKEFAGEPIAFWLVYPNATETLAGVVRHQADYGLGGATLIHPGSQLLAAMHPRLTPEAAVMVPGGSSEHALRIVYLGRIDDRYVDIGRERPRATRHDLEDAIIAVLAHRPVAPPGGPPVGCGIISEAALGKR
jgi:thiol-disulfide isomerase/thioredoxin